MPFKECYWHICPHMYDDVRANIQEMLDIGAFQKLHSPLASTVILVQKKDCSLRFCIYLRKLNNWTIKDTHSLPGVDEHLADKALNGSLPLTWSQDTGRSRWTRKVNIDCSHSGAIGLLWVQKNVFQTHQHPCYISEAYGDLSWGPQSPLVHHLLRWHSHLLQGSSQPPWEARGWSPETGGGWTQAQAFQMWVFLTADSLLRACDFCPRSSHWWGQNQSYQEVANTHKHHRVLTFSGIHGILPSVYPQINAGSPTPAWVNFRWECWQEKAAIQWDSRCQQAFNNLKKLCTTAPIPVYTDFTHPFKLHTDACGSGLGVVLYQTHDDGTDAVIAYASRSLSKAESHYPAHKLEFLAFKWVVVEKFHECLYGLTFDMYTDNNPLTYMLTTAKLDAASHHWVASLANYNFWLYYQAGKTIIDADTLSRVSWPVWMPDNSGTHLKVTATAVWAVQEAALKSPASPTEAYSYNLCILDAVQDSQQATCITLENWHQAQQADPTLSLVISRLQDVTLGWWKSKFTNPPEFSLFLQEQNHLLLKQGILYRWARPRESEETPLAAGLTSCTERGCSEGMPWWGWSSRPGMHAWSHVWPVLLALHGCSGKGTYWKVLPLPYPQS